MSDKCCCIGIEYEVSTYPCPGSVLGGIELVKESDGIDCSPRVTNLCARTAELDLRWNGTLHIIGVIVGSAVTRGVWYSCQVGGVGELIRWERRVHDPHVFIAKYEHETRCIGSAEVGGLGFSGGIYGRLLLPLL